ncbi:hypothetical protein FLONG3_7637 [Fusarium longipes]|uniref:Uncharacterized protein n=1 Tax=Fusarium longipes TaxID=694270 RepID=A0A395SCT1_9HYPO|nr:hypothetical protein FLONG3_7637 [Fusarium longipes]
MKVNRAQERCLGGVMVWAISHDTEDARYSKALALMLGRKASKGSIDNTEKPGTWTKKPFEQCRWSNCKESCPKGWIHVGRSDNDGHDGELMYDETGCGGDGQHNFCCPPDEDIPECGWYNHGNGACQKSTSCPKGMSEIGSNQMYCNHKPMVQTACCTTESNSMKVYGQCTWGTYPDCDSKPSCPSGYHDPPVASSGSGSGGLQCNNAKTETGLELRSVQMRNYCCGTDPDMQFTDCIVYRNIGSPIKDHEGACRSNCPSDRVRVAIDWAFEACDIHPVGGQATCCKTTYAEDTWKPNENLDDYKETMADWIEDPYCPSPSKVLKRRELSSSSTELAVRADKTDSLTPEGMLIRILGSVGTQLMLDELRKIWNRAVRDRYFYLQTTYMSNYIRNNWRLDYEGPVAFARKILCYPGYWAQQIEAALSSDGDAKPDMMNCTYAYLCFAEGSCGDDGDDGTANAKRDLATLFSLHSNQLSHSSHRHHHTHHHLSRRLLEKRKSIVINIVEKKTPSDSESDGDSDGDSEGDSDGDSDDNGLIDSEYKLEVPAHPQIPSLAQDNPLRERVVELRERNNCLMGRVVMVEYKASRHDKMDLELEHVLDKNIYETFLEGSALGILPSGQISKYGPIPIRFWDEMSDTDLRKEPGVPKHPGSRKPQLGTLFERAYECLGSKFNDDIFMITQNEINDAKNFLFRFEQKPGENSIETRSSMVKESKRKSEDEWIDDTVVIFSRIRASFAVFSYMNLDETRTRLNRIIKDVYVQFKFAENVYNKKHPGEKVQLANYWLEYMTDHFAKVVSKFRTNIEGMDTQIEGLMKKHDVEEKYVVRARGLMAQFKEMANNRDVVRIDTTGFPAFNSPITDDDGDEEMGGT